MRDEKDFSRVPTAITALTDDTLSLAEWDALPVSTRIGERVVEILILASEIRAELQHDEAAGLRWIAPDIDAVFHETDALLQRLAS